MNHQHHGSGHKWMMVACVVAMLGLPLYLFISGQGWEGIRSSWVFLLVCPLLHIGMMLMMGKNHCSEKKRTNEDVLSNCKDARSGI